MAEVGRPSLRPGLQCGRRVGQGSAESLPGERIRLWNNSLRRLLTPAYNR